MPDILFQIANLIALTGWVLIVIRPDAPYLKRVIHGGIILVLALTYIVVLPIGFSEAAGGGFNSIEEVRNLFDSDYALLAGWLHYLAFDLFVGLWVNHQSREAKLSNIARIPCLLLTFMAGPSGLLLFLLIRKIKERSNR